MDEFDFSIFDTEVVELTRSDMDMIVALAKKGFFDRSPKSNWVEKAGGLPAYIEEVAKHIYEGGATVSAAISGAISRIRKWLATSKDPKVKAKCAKALAQWEKMKASTKAKKLVKASRQDGSEYLVALSYDMDDVRSAFNRIESERRKNTGYDEPFEYRYVKRVFNDCLIVENDNEGGALVKVPYTVSGGAVEFGEEIPVRQAYVEIPEPVEVMAQLSAGDANIFALSAPTAETPYADVKLSRYPIGTADDLRASWAAYSRAEHRSEVTARFTEAAALLDLDS